MKVNEKYIGESKMKDKPNMKLAFDINEGSVTTDKLMDGAVTPDKLEPGLWENIDSTNRETQEGLNRLQEWMNEFAGGLEITANTDSYEAGKSASVTITARTKTGKKGDWVIRDSNNVTVYEKSDISQITYNQTIDKDTYYSIICKQGDQIATGQWAIIAAFPKWLGAGNSYTDIKADAYKRVVGKKVEGRYEVTVASGQRIYLLTPKEVIISKVTMGGFEIPMNDVEEVTLAISGYGNKVYKVYESSNTYQEGTYQVSVNVSDSELVEHIEAIDKKIDSYPVADGEDIVAVTKTQPTEQQVLMLADKAYHPASFSGLGRKYLRKNIIPIEHEYRVFGGFVENVEAEMQSVTITSGSPLNVVFDRVNEVFLYGVGLGKTKKYYMSWSSEEVPVSNYALTSEPLDMVFMYNGVPYKWNGENLLVDDEIQEDGLINLLTQDMINEPNTIYHIQYDYDLNGQTITIPEGCTLEFNGGSLRNGNLSLNDTIISNAFHCVDVELSGKIYEDTIKAEMLTCDDNTLFRVCNAIASTIILEKDKQYNISNTIALTGDKTIVGNNASIIGTENKILISTYDSLSMKDLSLYGISYIIRLLLTDNTSNNNKHLCLKNIVAKTSASTGQIHVISGTCNSIEIENCVIEGGYCGLLFSGQYYKYSDTSNISINNCKIRNTYASSCIQISYFVKGSISNNILSDFRGNGIATSHCKNIEVNGNKIYNYYVPSGSGNGYGIVFSLETIYSKAYNNIIETDLEVGGGIASDLFLDNAGTKKTEIGSNTIVNNSIAVRGNGIILNGSDNSVVGNNVINNCAVAAIRANKSDNAVIHDNKITTSLKCQTIIQCLSSNTISVHSNEILVSKEDVEVTYFMYITNCAGTIFSNNIKHFGTSTPNTGNYILYLKDSKFSIARNHIEFFKYLRLYTLLYGNNSTLLEDNNTFIAEEECGIGKIYSVNNSTLIASNNVVQQIKNHTYLENLNGTSICSITDIRNNVLFSTNYSEPYVLFNNTLVDVAAGVIKDPNIAAAVESKRAGSAFYDMSLQKRLTANRKLADELSSTVVDKNETVYIENTLKDGYSYIIDSSYHTGVIFTFSFSKNNNPDDDGAVVIFSNTEKQRLITALNPVEYPYIKMKMGNYKVTAKIYSTTVYWVESDGAKAGVNRNGTFANKPSATDIYVGFKYFCTDKQTAEGQTNGIEIIHKGNDVWVDALGRVVS